MLEDTLGLGPGPGAVVVGTPPQRRHEDEREIFLRAG
jgi:hypothetical protein